MPLVDPLYTGVPLGHPTNTWGYTGTPLEKLSWNSPTLECHWRNLVESAPHWDATGETITFVAYTGIPLERLWQPTHAPTHPGIHASLKWQDGRTPVSKWTGLCIFSLYLEFTALQWMPVLLLTHVSTSTLHMNAIIVFVYLWLQVKWNQLSSNNSHHTSCIHKGSHDGKWPDLMTSKPDSVSTLGYHWTDHTGRPL